MMGLYARAYCLFANIGKQFMNRPREIPLSLCGRYLTGCTACTSTKKEREYCRKPDLGCSQGELRSGSVTLIPLTGESWVEVQAMNNIVVVFSDPCQVTTFSSTQKKQQKHMYVFFCLLAKIKV